MFSNLFSKYLVLVFGISIPGFATLCLSQTEKPETPADGPVHFSEHLIADKYAYSYGLAAADLDGDGDIDLTSADALPHNKLYWFENDGKGNLVRKRRQGQLHPARDRKQLC